MLNLERRNKILELIEYQERAESEKLKISQEIDLLQAENINKKPNSQDGEVPRRHDRA